MQDAWHIFKWVWAAAFCTYSVVQVLALRRFKGDQKKRSNFVLTFMVILMGVSDAIRSVFFFEKRPAGRVGMLIVGSAAVTATILLIAMFGESPDVARDSQDDERKLQSLNLG